MSRHSPPETPSFTETVTEKDWFAADDTLTLDTDDTHIGNALYRWSTDSYIAMPQIIAALKDPDVLLGVIEPSDDHPFEIAVYDPGDMPPQETIQNDHR